jgi:hypothetical protein
VSFLQARVTRTDQKPTSEQCHRFRERRRSKHAALQGDAIPHFQAAALNNLIGNGPAMLFF